MLDRNDPAEFADEHADVRHDPRRANPYAAYRRVADSITSGATRRGRGMMREREKERGREMVLSTEEGKGLDALAFGFHNTVAVYWSDVRAQRSRTKREKEREREGMTRERRVGKEGMEGRN